jgi:hypothetical protein
VWKTGDAVQITCKGRTVVGSVLLASGNGRSLMLQFEALLAGYAGMMPVSWDEAREVFRGLVCGSPVELMAPPGDSN